VAPLHPLRDDARAFAARAGAALAVFFTIAVVLLAGGADQPIANAEANKGDTGAGDTAAMAQGDVTVPDVPAPEPVLGEPPVAEEPVQEAPAEPVPAEPVPPVEPPVSPDPPAGAPALSGDDDDDDDGDDHGREGDHGDDDDGPSGGGKGRDDDDHGRSGGHKDDDDGDDDEDDGDDGDDEDDSDDGEPSGGGPNEEAPPPSGGGKGNEGDDDDSDDSGGEPAQSGRPQVTLPGGQEPSTAPSQTDQAPVTQDPGPGGGGGTGALRDGDAREGEGAPERERQARFTNSSAGDGDTTASPGPGTGGAAAGDVAGSDPATGTSAPAPSGGGAADDQGSGGRDRRERPSSEEQSEPEPNIVTRTVRDFVEVVPDSLKAALAALAALSVLLGTGYLLAALRARRLARQRRELLQEVGLLQTALLPPVPEKMGSLLTSVAYRPADGPGAGGDFYDVLPLAGDRVGFILGDVSGHGRGALARTAFMRYTLRAYLEAGLEPRVALQVAGRVIDENLGGDFATVLLAVHDPETGSLTYATAGHPAPIVVGPQPHDPVTAGSSPPIGVGVRTGLRQTTVPLVPGSVAALFTDGLLEARTEDGILGRERLAELLAEIGDDASARGLIERVAAEANVFSDDMAAVVVKPTAGVTAGLFRTEQLELSARELDGPIARRFLEACGLPEDEVDDAERDARLLADRFGGVVLHVVFGNRLSVEVLPRNVESIEAASRRVSAGSAS
jgi:hypothetical protein